MIGPNVIQAIIDKASKDGHAHPAQVGFPFLFALCVLASLIIWFGVDVEKGRRDAVGWAEEIRKGNASWSEDDSVGMVKQ